MANTLITQLNNPAVLQRLNKQAAFVSSILLVIACAYLLAELTWMLVPQEKVQAEYKAQTNRPVANNQPSQQQQVRQLAAANLFGQTERKAVQRQTKAPETRLNLTLRGVLAATPMEMASAIISQGKAGKEEIYSIGDKISGGVTVKEIHADHVMLDRNGRLEVLRLPKDNSKALISSTRKTGSIGSMPASGSSGDALKKIRTEIMKNPTSFADYALPIVVKENGKQVGYRLKPQRKGKMLKELGLEPSDVITQINGVSLSNQQNGIAALRKLTTANSLTLVVKRNGAEVPLNISLR